MPCFVSPSHCCALLPGCPSPGPGPQPQPWRPCRRGSAHPLHAGLHCLGWEPPLGSEASYRPRTPWVQRGPSRASPCPGAKDQEPRPLQLSRVPCVQLLRDGSCAGAAKADSAAQLPTPAHVLRVRLPALSPEGCQEAPPGEAQGSQLPRPLVDCPGPLTGNGPPRAQALETLSAM